MTRKEAWEIFNKELTANILKQQAMQKAEASGNFRAFIESDASIFALEDNRFTKLGTEYTKEIDVGRSPGKLPPIQPIKEWVDLKKYGISFANDRERDSIAWGIAKKMAKKGGYKRRNTSKRTNIFANAISESMPTLSKLLAESFIFEYELPVQKEINTINNQK